jgi:DNA repair protein RecO (recombination protein O)
MQVKTRAIVLHSLKYGESQIIVDLFTEAHGRLSFIQRIPKTGRARVKKQLFQPLTLLRVEFDYRPGQRLLHIADAQMETPFVSLPFDAHKLCIALFVAEFTCYATRSEQANAALFAYIEASVKWLDACGGNFANFHIIYMLRLTRFIGFYPNTDDACVGAYFDLCNACFVTHAPLHPDFLEPTEARQMGLLMRVSYATMHLVKMSRTERNRCVELILKYYRLHEPDFPELKSLPVLMELFA